MIVYDYFPVSKEWLSDSLIILETVLKQKIGYSTTLLNQGCLNNKFLVENAL